jgi:hypothetical protein
MTRSSPSTRVAQRIADRFSVKFKEDKSVGIGAGRSLSKRLLWAGEVLTIGDNDPSRIAINTTDTPKLNLLFI